jgi:purine-binding chemotaxis protein CheW
MNMRPGSHPAFGRMPDSRRCGMHFSPVPTEGGSSVAQRAQDLAEITESAAELAGKYLTFSLNEEEYGIGILKVKEIIGMMPITPVPQTPDFVKGIVNLRGKVIPVIDLRLRFSMPAIDYNDRTCIIVVEIQGGSGQMYMGIVVDSVSEVLNIKPGEIERAPSFGTNLRTDYILGMAKMDGGVKILLDIDLVLTSEEMRMLGNVV